MVRRNEKLLEIFPSYNFVQSKILIAVKLVSVDLEIYLLN